MDESTQPTLPRSDSQVCKFKREEFKDPKNNRNDDNCPYCQINGVLVLIVEHRSENDLPQVPSGIEINYIL